MCNEGSIGNEIILPKRVVQQPQPPLHDEGDCGACVLAGLLGITVEAVYERKGKVEPFFGISLAQFLHDADARGELDRLILDVPFWPSSDLLRNFGNPSWLSNLQWFRYVRMALDGGYYGLLHYNMDGVGPFAMADHFVMVVGARDRTVPHPKVEGAYTTWQELLISDSSTRRPDEYWIDHLQMLREHGGYNLALARPR